jgi:anti-sigma regulatory factor (Ser/Thr protein kinase)
MTLDTMSVSLEPASWTPTFACALARRFVARCRFDDPAQVTCLLVTELVTNAVTHGGWGITLEMRGSSSAVCSKVFDHGHALPVMVPRRPLADSGRGLHLVAALASDWGVEPVADGKVVWFELRHPVESVSVAAFDAQCEATGGEPARKPWVSG